MTGGASAERGFEYQKLYLAWKLLAAEADALLSGESEQELQSVAVEAGQEGGGPAWDIELRYPGGRTRLRECKDTAITREDRQTFFRRIRKAIDSGAQVELMEPGWVTDTTKQSNYIKHWKVAQRIVTGRKLPPLKNPARVISGESALQEAMFFLCSKKADKSKPLTRAQAKKVVLRVSFEDARLSQLRENVGLLAESVFEKGTGDALKVRILGEVTTRVAEKGEARYSRQQLIETIGSGSLAEELRGTYRDILRFCSAGGRNVEVAVIEWSLLPGCPTHVWPIQDRLPALAEALDGCAVVSSVGTGKTTTTLQAFEQESKRLLPRHVLHLSAGKIEPDVIRALPGLCCLLAGVSRTWVAIDALDEAPDLHDLLWKQTLHRLQGVPNLTLVVTVREEVLSAKDWLQELVAGLRELRLDRLTIAQVCEAFQSVGLDPPNNTSLIECLRVPFLFSIYARLIAPGETPELQGEVTGFHVIHAFWSRRAAASSSGMRLLGDGDGVVEKRMALESLALQSQAGEETLKWREETEPVRNGVEMLKREGIVLNHTATSVRWAHAWLEQYALVELLAKDATTAVELAAAVSDQAVDHVGRSAAAGAVKWLQVRRDFGSIEDFVVELYGRSAGRGSDAIGALVEGPPTTIVLATLPAGVLSEFLSQAIQVRATQWQDQVRVLPADVFVGDNGELHDIVTRYETEVVP